jgi:hypothetical protein
MAGDSANGRTKIAHRFLLCSALTAASVLGLASTAFGAVHSGPRITPAVASFTIPVTNKPGVWTLYLRHHGQVIGTDSGTAGTLSVNVPASFHGMVQADVRRNTHWFSGNRFFVHTSGTGGGGGGTGGGGTGGGGGGSTPTTTVPPLKAASGGATPIPGYVPPAPAPVTLVTQPETRASGSALAFTGAGPTLWMAALAGLGFVLCGAYLVARRPEVTVVHSLETLMRPHD